MEVCGWKKKRQRLEDKLTTRPNPFSGQTFIRYQLSAPGPVRLYVYNIAGQVVKVLVKDPNWRWSIRHPGMDGMSGRA